jgi:hypothetical protein
MYKKIIILILLFIIGVSYSHSIIEGFILSEKERDKIDSITIIHSEQKNTDENKKYTFDSYIAQLYNNEDLKKAVTNLIDFYDKQMTDSNEENYESYNWITHPETEFTFKNWTEYFCFMIKANYLTTKYLYRNHNNINILQYIQDKIQSGRTLCL